MAQVNKNEEFSLIAKKWSVLDFAMMKKRKRSPIIYGKDIK